MSGSLLDLSFSSLVGDITPLQLHIGSSDGVVANLIHLWKWSPWWQEMYTLFKSTFFVWRGADISLGWDRWQWDSWRRRGKIGVKSLGVEQVCASSVHSERDASLIIAILTLHTKDRIALNYICCTAHSRWTLKAQWPRVWDRGRGPPTRPQQQDWVAGVLLGRLIGEFPLNKLHLICLGTRATFAFWGLILSTRSQGNGKAHSPQIEPSVPLKNI